jgi:hypothetical protein
VETSVTFSHALLFVSRETVFIETNIIILLMARLLPINTDISGETESCIYIRRNK